jgi:hypothetical protein
VLRAGGHYRRHCRGKKHAKCQKTLPSYLIFKNSPFIFFFYVTVSQNKISTNKNKDKIITVICKNQECRRKFKYLQKDWHFNYLQLPSPLKA